MGLGTEFIYVAIETGDGDANVVCQRCLTSKLCSGQDKLSWLSGEEYEENDSNQIRRHM